MNTYITSPPNVCNHVISHFRCSVSRKSPKREVNESRNCKNGYLATLVETTHGLLLFLFLNIEVVYQCSLEMGNISSWLCQWTFLMASALLFCPAIEWSNWELHLHFSTCEPEGFLDIKARTLLALLPFQWRNLIVKTDFLKADSSSVILKTYLRLWNLQ